MSIHKPSLTFVTRSCAVLLAIACILLSSGCATRTIPGAGSRALAINGGVHGGQQPIVGSHVYLFATHTDNTGTTASSLLPSPATTDANGAFTLDPASYSCTSPNDQVLFVAAGGDPGAGTINNAITLIDLFGSCGNLSASSFVVINEVTTVAAAFALAPVYGNSYQGSYFPSGFDPQELFINNSSLTDPAQVAQLFSNATTLVDPATGVATLSSGSLVQQTINALGDAAAACVNSANANTLSCQDLFYTTWETGMVPPTDTFLAFASLAQKPDQVWGSLVSLAAPTAPFQPTLSADPQTWAIPAFYTNTLSLNWSPMAHPTHGLHAQIR